MKTHVFKSTGLLLLFGLLMNLQYSNAQDRKLSRQELKEVRKARMEANFIVLDSILNSKNFVLRADYLRDDWGVNIPVISNLNFILVNEEGGVLQTGSPAGIGYNGVGGVTAKGMLGRWEMTSNNKNLTYTVRFNLVTNLGNYDVLMHVGANGNASATISGLGPGKLTWSGYLLPVEDSRIYEGQITTI
ncbi:MAG TPA: DUF4251 domain-containing protein [Bacteroidales bacterium]|nr:DUF4251 domain-containing protein [Bacteroidales bacterium]HPF02021.1 DUF4251 domain-containing protein [Bacteroidales bacterium]HPJ59790.1 DUF4251 domain-containing protein [Bacteroidales bacterium]HPR12563.1 DUF4251 domain-containing protein [Bacteroidales bacterium]HRW86692.1 DUF4251 domain-containing protein [Bacteroidales bacterium]